MTTLKRLSSFVKMNYQWGNLGKTTSKIGVYQIRVILCGEVYFYSPAHRIWFPENVLHEYGMPVVDDREANTELYKLRKELNSRGIYFGVNFLNGTYRAVMHTKIKKVWTSEDIGEPTLKAKETVKYIHEKVKELLGI